MHTDIDKARGMLFGLAIGDAFGKPVEFLSLAGIMERYGASGITELPEPALYTDDTQMTLALAEALATSGERDIDTLMEAVSLEFVKWLNSPENDRAPGRTCISGVRAMEGGAHWSKAGAVRSKGCGSAMRVAPVGYLYQHDETRLREAADATGLCTHAHPAAVAACAAAAWMVKLALDGVGPGDMIDRMMEFTEGVSEEFDRAMNQARNCLDWEDETRALKSIGEGWTGEEAVALATWCYVRYPDDYPRMILRAANTNGDSDSVACIAGAACGARLGIRGIPGDWARRIENADMIENLATRLARKKAEWFPAPGRGR
ncbi:MAG: ADP-ribosylglycohydrolase family protein [Desulfatibacillaceae bacterium]